MLYIKKGPEPQSLTDYRRNSNAYFDGYDSKDDIRKQLLAEQGYLCAYCMSRISINSMKIEHWIPESNLSEMEALDYSNMLGVCLGHIKGDPGKDDTCDAKKGNCSITVDPRRKDHIEKIQYRSKNGEIYSTDPSIDEDLNHTLNLNSRTHFLPAQRLATLEAVISQMSAKHSKGLWTDRFLNKFIKMYETPNGDGMKRPFAGIVLWYLKKKSRKTL